MKNEIKFEEYYENNGPEENQMIPGGENIQNLNEINNSIKPLFVNNYHTAAVKALSWCPWQRHVLATGGGSKDRTLKIFNCDRNDK